MVKERAFLHSIANPLATAKFVLDMVIEDVAARPVGDKELLAQLGQINDAIDQATRLISARRGEILKETHD